MKKKHIFIVGSALILMASLLVSAYLLIVRHYEKILFDTSDQDQFAEQFLADHRFIASQAEFDIFFVPDQAIADAGPFLNPKINWLNSDAQERKIPELADWIGQIHLYDHWNLESSGPLHDYINETTAPDNVNAPSPDWGQLRQEISNRLQWGKDTAKLNQVIDEIHHLARLIASTESFIANMVALAVLRDIEEHKRPEYRRSSADWIRVRRGLWGLMAYLRFNTPDSIRSKIFDTPVRLAGLCGAANESSSQNYGIYHMVGPFYSDRFASLSSLYEIVFRKCISTRGQKVWKNRESLPRFLQGNVFDQQAIPASGHEKRISGETMQWNKVKSLPLLHRIIGLQLATVGSPSYLGLYKELGQENRRPSAAGNPGFRGIHRTDD